MVHCEDLPSVLGDGTLLLQVFQNLIGNALKYRSVRRPEVRVSATRLPDAVQFSIRDNGIGIDARYFERIFGVQERT